jgi:two-component system response regulator HydG
MRANNFDLKDLLTYDNEEGIISIMGHRALLFDAVALGLLRKELVDSLGVLAARAILTRFGYAHGWRVAEVLRSEFPAIFSDVQAGAHSHKLCGITLSTDFKHSDGKGDEPLIMASWINSYEVEQHLLHLGKSDESVCWTLTGFASGYESCKNGREVYFIEHKCVGKGDAVCQMSGKFKDKWGPEVEQQLTYFSISSADQMLIELTRKLKKTENRITNRQRQLGLLEKTKEEQFGFIIRSKAMQEVVELAQHVAKVDTSVVVMGESGVGKERISRIIHDQSIRTNKPFVAVNCGALTETLLESELFGHAKGSFTGADRDRPGIFEEASGGTLFLDEIGEISPGMQVKILRVLQEKEVRRVGESKVRPINVRIIAATNRDLAKEVAEGRFRRDLYYRLCVIEIVVPTLRERPEDILPLARLFLQQSNEDMKRAIAGFSPHAAERLLNFNWPGNVRELQNVVARGVALCKGKFIEPKDLPMNLQTAPTSVFADQILTLEEVERNHILSVLRTSGGNKRLAAAKLDIGPNTLYRKLREYGIEQLEVLGT